MWKRKREESEEQGFNKSKKTPRSPSEAKREEGRKEGGIMGKCRKEMEEVIRGVMRVELREWKEEMRKVKEEVRVGWEEVKREMREAREEREELKEHIKGLKRRMEEIERREEVGTEKGKEGGKEGEGIKERISEIERKLERKEREEKKKNIVIRRLKVKEGKRKEAVEEAMKAIGVEIEAKEVWRIADERERGREMVVIRIEEGGKRKRS